MGAIGTCVAAVAAVVPFGRGGVRFIQLQGRGKGDKYEDEWEFHRDLRVKNGRVQGKLRWKWLKCPPSLPFADKVGISGFELVEGTLEHGILSVSGQKAVADEPGWAGLGNYTIHLPASGKAFEGKMEPQHKKAKYAESGTLRGTVAYFRKPPPGFE